MDSLFTKIIHGEVSSYKVYEDEYVYAFLDINQFHQGKILIVPKVHIDHFFDIPAPYYQALFEASKILAPVIKQVFGSERVAMVIEWLEIAHAHIKLFPINKAGDIWHEPMSTLDHQSMLDIQNKIVTHL